MPLGLECKPCMVEEQTTLDRNRVGDSSLAVERLRELDLSAGPLLILTHDNPDPDSLASATALRELLRSLKGIDGTVTYSGIIGRAENRAMVSLLGLEIHHISELKMTDFAHFALIDAQPHTGNTAVPAEMTPDIVIDHHPLREQTRRARYYDVRDDIGASATLLTEYMRAADVQIPKELATALLYGIRSETQDLGRETSDADREAYQYLLARADAEKLAMISRPVLDPQYFRQMAEALDSIRIADTVAICSLEDVIEPDFIPEMADFFVRMEGLRWVLVYGRFRDRIHLSIRTNDVDAAAGETMQQLLEDIGRGGGHGMRAGGNIEPAASKIPESEISDELRRRFLRLLDKEDVPLRPLAGAGE